MGAHALDRGGLDGEQPEAHHVGLRDQPLDGRHQQQLVRGGVERKVLEPLLRPHVHLSHEVDATHAAEVGAQPRQHDLVVGRYGAEDGASGRDRILTDAPSVAPELLDHHGQEHGRDPPLGREGTHPVGHGLDLAHAPRAGVAGQEVRLDAKAAGGGQLARPGVEQHVVAERIDAGRAHASAPSTQSRRRPNARCLTVRTASALRPSRAAIWFDGCSA